MFVPEFFYGKFSDVEKKLKSIRSKRKTLENVKLLYEKINSTLDDSILHDDYVIALCDDYLGMKMKNAYYPFAFSNYIMFEEDDDSDISKWYKEKTLECKWCQITALTTNSLAQFLYYDKEYSRQLGDSICSNWDFYMSLGERFCFVPIFQKMNNHYYFWENNLALCKLIVSVAGKDFISLEDLEHFPEIWKKCVKNF